jgi:hypothetical protein
MVHIVNFSPVRRTPKHTDFHDDPIPLTDVTICVRSSPPVPVPASRAEQGLALLPAPLSYFDDKCDVLSPGEGAATVLSFYFDQ